MLYKSMANVMSTTTAMPSISRTAKMKTTAAVAIPFGAFNVMNMISPMVYSLRTLSQVEKNLIKI